MNQAREIFGQPIDRVQNKVRPFMVEWVQEFIKNSPFAVLATSNSDGYTYASPKGGEPGFVKVIDERRLVIPDIPGNKLFQGYGNIESNPHVGLVFFIPGIDAVARVNGSVHVLRNGAREYDRIVADAFTDEERKSIQQFMILDVRESYSHCPRALVGSNLWGTDVIEANREEAPIPKWIPGT